MKLMADESVEGPTVSALRAAGHVVLAIALKEEALLLTADKDFGELVFRNHAEHCGVLLIRSVEDDLDENAANTLAAIEQHGPELLNRFSVLAGRGLRIRKAKNQGRLAVLEAKSCSGYDAESRAERSVPSPS